MSKTKFYLTILLLFALQTTQAEIYSKVKIYTDTEGLKKIAQTYPLRIHYRLSKKDYLPEG